MPAIRKAVRSTAVNASVPRMILSRLAAIDGVCEVRAYSGNKITDLDQIGDHMMSNADHSFSYTRTVKNLLDLAPILNELASAFRAYGFRPNGTNKYKDGDWKADVELKGLTVTVQFSPA